jgi:hypothetical protein
VGPVEIDRAFFKSMDVISLNDTDSVKMQGLAPGCAPLKAAQGSMSRLCVLLTIYDGTRALRGRS